MNGKIVTETDFSNNEYYGLSLTLYHIEGTISIGFTYRIWKNIFEFGGTARVNVTARTGGNPGFTF